ncbi:uncharacterized protein LOC120211753 [Hibiscus syriacus]|uniref:uncharacterized protein LOC120211753 n=1 Tax=Hibiscus syriacus TaxID=106335 RepID=UPI001921C1C8|nr:uncharacterized protein LOC120211753 [Hibiscus syriacus]
MCPLCSYEDESVLHALRSCPCTLDVLRHAGIPVSISLSDIDPLVLWLEEALSILGLDDFVGFLVYLWNVWNNRNSFVHDAKFQQSWILVSTAKTLHHEYLQAMALDRMHENPFIQHNRWLPPPPGVIKINFDGSFDNNGRLASIVVVARDHNGLVQGGLAQVSGRCADPTFVEFFALLASLRLVNEKGWLDLQFESDSQIFVNKITRDSWATCSGSAFFFDSICPDIIASVISKDVITS